MVRGDEGGRNRSKLFTASSLRFQIMQRPHKPPHPAQLLYVPTRVGSTFLPFPPHKQILSNLRILIVGHQCYYVVPSYTSYICVVCFFFHLKNLDMCLLKNSFHPRARNKFYVCYFFSNKSSSFLKIE